MYSFSFTEIFKKMCVNVLDGGFMSFALQGGMAWPTILLSRVGHEGGATPF